VSFLRKDISAAIDKLKSNGIDPDCINVSISSNLNLSGWLNLSEPECAISVYFAEIELYTDENFETKETIGKAKCYFLRGYDWPNEGFVDLRDLADSMSGNLLTAIVPVTDDDGVLLDDYFGSNVLYIDQFYIKPEYRQKGIGSLVFPLLLDILSQDVGAVTIIPAPTEDNGEKRIKSDHPNYKLILNDMCKFIMGFGFFCADRQNRVWVKNTQLRD
jgi:GNAT superfamily N-acetyltransferase